MRVFKKRLLPVALSLLLVVSFLPLTAAFADDDAVVSPGVEDIVAAPQTEVQAPGDAGAAAEHSGSAIEATAGEEAAAEAEEPVNPGGFSTLAEAQDAGVVSDLPDDPATYEDGEIIVVLADDVPVGEEVASVENDIAELSDYEDPATEILNPSTDDATIALIELPADVDMADALLEAANNENVLYAHPNYNLYLVDSVEAVDAGGEAGFEPLATANDPFKDTGGTVRTPWWLEGASSNGINARTAWSNGYTTSKSVIVAVFDTGARMNHEDLTGNILSDLAIDASTNPVSKLSTSSSDYGGDAAANGHGTHVAGIIGAVANNGKGVAGVSYNASILPVKIFNNKGGCSAAMIIRGYTYVREKKAAGYPIRVINMSIGTYDVTDIPGLENAIKAAKSEGILTVCAAGNGHDTNGDDVADVYTDICYPSDFADVISVTATTTAGVRASYSDYNQYKDIAAPGNSILSTLGSGTAAYGMLSGTSMASPMVAGVAAMMFAKNPTLTPDQVQTYLQNTARDVLPAGRDDKTGYGIVDAQAALAAVPAPPTYTVTFKNWDGSVLKTQSGIAYGSAATAPTTNPTRSGYIFVGWDKDFSNVTANLTVTAQFALDFNNKVMCITNGSLRFDVPGNSVISGAVLNLWTATHGPNQRFRFVSTGDGYYKIVCVGSGMLLDVRGASATAGTPVIQWPEASGGAANNQKWKIEVSGSGYRLVTKLNSNYCIDTTSSKLSTGNTLVLAKVSSGKASQTYKFEVKGQTSGITDLGTYTIAASSATNQLIDIEGASLADGAQALLWKKNGNANQKFLFSYDSSSGYYVIQCVKSSAVFDVYGGSTAAGTRIIQWPVNYQFNQKWDVVQVSGNTYQIYSARSSMALDAYGGSTANNTKVIVWPENGGANQKWVIKAA